MEKNSLRTLESANIGSILTTEEMGFIKGGSKKRKKGSGSGSGGGRGGSGSGSGGGHGHKHGRRCGHRGY